MPLRLIWYIIVLVFLFIFIGLNLGNVSDINLWFSEAYRYTDVPIVISFFIMYLLGAVSVIPFVVGNELKRQRKKKKQSAAQALPASENPAAAKAAKKAERAEKKAEKKKSKELTNADGSETEGREIL